MGSTRAGCTPLQAVVIVPPLALLNKGIRPLTFQDGRPILRVQLPLSSPNVHLVRLQARAGTGETHSQAPWLRVGIEAVKGDQAIYRLLFQPIEAGQTSRAWTVVVLGGEEVSVVMDCLAAGEAPSAPTTPQSPIPRPPSSSAPVRGLLVLALLFLGMTLLYVVTLLPLLSGLFRPDSPLKEPMPSIPPPPPDTLVQREVDLDGDGVPEVVRVIPDFENRRGTMANASKLVVLNAADSAWSEVPVLSRLGQEGADPDTPEVRFERFRELQVKDLTNDGRDEVLLWSNAGAHATLLDILTFQSGGWQAHRFFSAGNLEIDDSEVVITPHRSTVQTRYHWAGAAFQEI